jgi:hypothetical protein
MTATITPFDLGPGGVATGKVEFFAGTTKLAETTTITSGVASVSSPILLAPAMPASVTAKFTSTNPQLTSGESMTKSLTVTQEDARSTYTGASLFFASSTSATSATATLSATIKDITAVIGDSAYDPDQGNITNARIDFVNELGTVYPGCGNLVPSLVSSSDTKVGTVSCQTSMSISNSSGSQYTVKIVVRNYYTDTTAGDATTVITVAQPLTSSFITGGGYLLNPTSTAGTYAGDGNRKTNFGFNVKYNKSGTNCRATSMSSSGEAGSSTSSRATH